MAECIIYIASSFFLYVRLLRYLRFFQQHEYNFSRFIAWVVEHRAFDKKGSLVAISTAAISALTESSTLVTLIGSLALCYIAMNEEDPRTHGKLTLKMTERAKRIFRTSFCLLGIINLLTALSEPPTMIWLLQIALFQSAPLFLGLSNSILQRGEKKRQAAFVQEAKDILARCNPFIIGITGSYGKSSSKDALGQILQVTLGPTFWPAKGVNTPMGTTAEIRARLVEGYKYAVMEMGAYMRGSIKRLCALTPPHAALITTVGVAHLERFGSEENIYLAKSELAQSVPPEGILVCNGDDPGARRMATEHKKKTTLLYGFDNSKGDLDCYVSTWKTTPQGTTFTLHWKGQTFSSITPLMGKAALSNLLGAFTMAAALGSNPEYILAVMHNLEPVNNRLELHKDGPITYLRDAYNSNPVGFATALDVLQELPGKRKILMTPGIIELGTKQYEENERIAQKAAAVCDLAIVVGSHNQNALKEGLLKGGLAPEKVLCIPDRNKALKELAAIKQEGDIILIENDLPDLYEANVKF